MKELVLTTIICISILGTAAAFFNMAETQRASRGCNSCPTGFARKKADCDCPAVSAQKAVDIQKQEPTEPVESDSVQHGRGAIPVERLESSLNERIREAFTRTGCPNTDYSEDVVEGWKSRNAFGVYDMYETCVQARNEVPSALELCGRPTSQCKITAVQTEFDDVRNYHEYAKQEKSTLFRPSYGTFDTLPAAKRHCDRTLGCKGVIFNSISSKFEARGGDEALAKEDILWKRGAFL